MQVAANQLILAPITLSTVFAWNLALTGQGHALGDKIRNDLWPTMQNGGAWVGELCAGEAGKAARGAGRAWVVRRLRVTGRAERGSITV